jgi:hypothetical protein
VGRIFPDQERCHEVIKGIFALELFVAGEDRFDEIHWQLSDVIAIESVETIFVEIVESIAIVL